MTANVINYFKLLEDKRSNQASEALRSQEIAEMSRHNLATEQEASRHNIAYEYETEMHNRATETEMRRSNIASEGLTAASIAETRRANQARELENYRSNVARETETHRSNKMREELDTYRVGNDIAKTILGGFNISSSVSSKLKAGGAK